MVLRITLVVALCSSSVFAQALSVVMLRARPTCFGASDGQMQVNVTGGTPPYTYVWQGRTETTFRLTGLPAGIYPVTVTDSVGASVTKPGTDMETYLTQPMDVFLTAGMIPVSCNGASTGRVITSASGGVGMFTYQWAHGPTTANLLGVPAGSYTVTVTDANDCKKTRVAVVTEPPALVVTNTSTDVTCFGANDGAANVSVTGGTPGYTYSWSADAGTAASATGLTAGSHTVTITDANSCQRTHSVNITQPAAALTATSVVTNANCYGVNTGAIDVTTSGGTAPYRFAWNDGVTTEDRSALRGGFYSWTITDTNGCTANRSTLVNQPSIAFTGSVVPTPPTCFGGSNGRLDATASGGQAPYTFNWGSGPQGPTKLSAAAGPHTVTITDAYACSTAVTTTLTQPPEILINATTQTNVSCNGGSNGALTIATSGGTGALTQAWAHSGSTSNSVSALAAGLYNVTATDSAACTTTRSFTITEPTALTVQTTAQATCPGESIGSASANASGGTAPFSYDWSPGAPAGDGTANLSSLALGVWNVEVVDAMGCQAAGNVSVAERTTAPLAQAQSVTTAEDTALAITLGAAESCGAPTFTVTTQPRHGTLTGTAPLLTYTPEANFFGADDFAFTVSGSLGTSNPATVSIAVTSVNDAPLAHSQSVTTLRETPLDITLTGSDVEGTSLTFSIVAAPQHGVLSGTAPAVSYAPNAGFVGDDSFTFTTYDGTDSSLPAVVSIVVEAVDAGVEHDAGVERDAGVEDAGTEPTDAGVEPVDAGMELVDAGMQPGTDAGVNPNPEPEPTGCGCTSAPGALLVWALGFALLRRRRGAP